VEKPQGNVGEDGRLIKNESEINIMRGCGLDS
jgi:hypothetical protein